MAQNEEHKTMLIGRIGNIDIDSSALKIKGENFFDVNGIVRSSFLLTLAGYLEKDNVTIRTKPFYQKQKLSRFFSYILNDKRVAPRLFKLTLTFKNNEEHNSSLKRNSYDCIVSFSGGIDSTAGILYALDKKMNVKPVWIGFGQKNEEEELKVIKKICKKLNLVPLIIRVDLKNYIDEGWTRWKMGIIPGRNFLFAAIASSIAQSSTKKKVKIYVCAHKEEVNPVNTDKSLRFFNTCTAIFLQFYKKNIELTSPFLTTTKPEIISYWVKKWSKKYNIHPNDTISCYFGTNCGNCKACINRVVAYSCAGLPVEKFKNNPFSDKEGLISNGYISRFNSLKLERKLDFLQTMKINEGYLPLHLKKFFYSRYNRYKSRIKTRTNRIQEIIIS